MYLYNCSLLGNTSQVNRKGLKKNPKPNPQTYPEELSISNYVGYQKALQQTH